MTQLNKQDMKAISHAFALLVLLYIATISPSSAATTASSAATTTSFDAASSFVMFTCKSATYPKLCENTCLPFAKKIRVDLKRMAHYALKAALQAAKSASQTAHQVSKEKKLKPSEKAAIKDCIELAKDSVTQIKQSLGKLDDMKNASNGNDRRRFRLSNVKTWISAGMTDHQTCLDGLEEVNASASIKTEISSKIRYATMVSSNALSIVNQIK